ncbi:hypothetical protein LCGC14_1721330 [marine sediment metagenome]|uniref:Uncharacterized protein n=1 Tax=marine sediment metagenome TaxID=412755 RepID=A0A0F9HC40_9ZZZZ
MELITLTKRPLKLMLRLNQKEAWELIQSLVGQMNHNDPNYERLESVGFKGANYFSISVEPDPIRYLTGGEINTLRFGLTSLINIPKMKDQTELDLELLRQPLLDTLNPIAEKLERIFTKKGE